MLPIQEFDFVVREHSYETTELLELISMALELLDFDYREAFVSARV